MTKKLQHGLIAVLLGSLSTLGSAAAFAQASGETQNPLPGPIQKVLTNYLGGKAFCQQYPDVTGKETSFRVTVPVDYKNPAAGTTEIYAFIACFVASGKDLYVCVR